MHTQTYAHTQMLIIHINIHTNARTHTHISTMCLITRKCRDINNQYYVNFIIIMYVKINQSINEFIQPKIGPKKYTEYAKLLLL